MKITSVNVHKKNDETRMKGIASVLLDDCFVIRDIRIIEGKDGLFIAMPSRKNADGEYVLKSGLDYENTTITNIISKYGEEK